MTGTDRMIDELTDRLITAESKATFRCFGEEAPGIRHCAPYPRSGDTADSYA